MRKKEQLIILILFVGLVFNTNVFGQTGSITFGSRSDAQDGTDANFGVVCVIDENHFIVAYSDFGNSGYGTIRLGTVSGTTITYGSEFVFLSRSIQYISAAKLDPTHVVLAFQDQGNSNKGATVILTINTSNGVITASGTEVFNDGTTGLLSVSAFDASNFIVAYTDVGNSDYGTAVIGTISPDDELVGFGAEYVFNSGAINFPSVTVLDADKFVIAYEDKSTGVWPGTAIVGSHTGSVLSFGTESVFHTDQTDRTKISKLDASHVVITYQDVTNTTALSTIGTISENTISFGSEYQYASVANYLGVATINTTTFVVVASVNEDGTAYTGTVTNGNQISYSSGAAYYTDQTRYYNDVACLFNTTGDAKFVALWEMNGLGASSIIGTVDDVAPLPVELTTFTAASTSTATGNQIVELNWQTATEVNNYGFDVETLHATSDEWETIGFVQGHGNSNSPKHYKFTDSESLPSGIRTYRLKQIDFDGKFEYSEIITVETESIPSQFALHQNYPNPFNPTTKISYQIPAAGFVNLKVYDLLGNELVTLVNEQKQAGTYEINFDGRDLSSGVYFYKLEAGNFKQIRKLMLIK